MSGAWEGLLLIDKPEGPTSHDIVDAVRRATSERRIGHGGTLDQDVITVELALDLGCHPQAPLVDHPTVNRPPSASLIARG